MKFHHHFFWFVLMSAFTASPGLTQTSLSSNDIVTSLQGLEASPVGFDVAALRRRAQENIRINPGINASTREPLSEELNKLAQLTVVIEFDFNSAAIRPVSYRTLGTIADALHHPYLLGYKFLVVGHTDAKGDRVYNLKLSQQRADAIREALVTTFRIRNDRGPFV